MRLQRPGFQLKVYPLEGDCGQPMLGLSQESLEKLKEVNVVFHMAATVRFDEKLRLATAINVQSTVDLLGIARTMPGLKVRVAVCSVPCVFTYARAAAPGRAKGAKVTDTPRVHPAQAFVHVSTAYSYPQNKVIEEKFYKPDVSPDRLLNIVNNMEDDMLNAITPQVITTWPNTYAFTKAVGEDAVLQHSKGLPVVMVRPSIGKPKAARTARPSPAALVRERGRVTRKALCVAVISTAKEPIAGWINNVYGPTGVVAGAGVGLLKVLNCDSERMADMVPVDMAINSVLAAGWDLGTRNTDNKQVRVHAP